MHKLGSARAGHRQGRGTAWSGLVCPALALGLPLFVPSARAAEFVHNSRTQSAYTTLDPMSPSNVTADSVDGGVQVYYICVGTDIHGGRETYPVTPGLPCYTGMCSGEQIYPGKH